MLTSLLRELTHKAYKIKMRVSCCEFEFMEGRTQRYMFRMADRVPVENEVNMFDKPINLFLGKEVDCFVGLFYEMVWSCFERHVLTKFQTMNISY
jgi:hypothetical protein